MKNAILMFLLLISNLYIASAQDPLAEKMKLLEQKQAHKNEKIDLNQKIINKKLQTPKHILQTTQTDAGESPQAFSNKPNIPFSPIDTAGRQFAKRFEIVFAGMAESYKLNDETIRFVKKDESSQVCFRYEGDLLFCDSAYQYVEDNFMSAYGRVFVIQNDSMSIQSDSLFYDGFSRIAQFKGNVVVKDGTKTVYTNNLDYNTLTKVAFYSGGGTVKDQTSILKSDMGYYFGDSKLASFKGNVSVNSEEVNLNSDTLTYNANDKKVYFNAPTKIIMADGNYIETASGFYDTVLGKTKISGKDGDQSRIENKDYVISGDNLDYDNITNKGLAKENVELYIKKDKMTIFGNHLDYNGVTNEMYVYGKGLMVRPYGKDTLYLAADTIIALDDSVAKKQQLVAYPHAKIYKSDMQAICDSLTYNMRDSIIYFDRDPVLWSDKNQLSARTIDVKMKNNFIDTLTMTFSAFVVALDEFENYNQIKGRIIKAAFKKNGYIHSINVDGNAESIFHLINEEKKTPSGLNNAICSKIDIVFADSNQIDYILFNKEAEGKLIPLHEITEENKNLKDFKWRGDDRPSVTSIMNGRTLKNNKPKKRIDPSTGRVIKNTTDENPAFSIEVEGNQIVYRKDNIDEDVLKNIFFLQIVPMNPIDLPEMQREAGLLFYEFNFTMDDLLGDGTLRKRLPDFPIKKIISGQNVAGGAVWKKVIEAKEK